VFCAVSAIGCADLGGTTRDGIGWWMAAILHGILDDFIDKSPILAQPYTSNWRTAPGTAGSRAPS
jgi:hypothetical protein